MMGNYVDRYDKKDKFYLVGYNNASFDNPFFRAFFAQCGDNYFGSWFWSCPIDVMVLAGQYLMGERVGMENFQQGTVAAHLGIQVDPERLHDAVYDVEVMREIYRYMYPI
jgi:DNA polymerase III subunit epsilon